MFRAADFIYCDDPGSQPSLELQYPLEFLNSIERTSALPDHEIALKKASWSCYFEKYGQIVYTSMVLDTLLLV